MKHPPNLRSKIEQPGRAQRGEQVIFQGQPGTLSCPATEDGWVWLKLESGEQTGCVRVTQLVYKEDLDAPKT